MTSVSSPSPQPPRTLGIVDSCYLGCGKLASIIDYITMVRHTRWQTYSKRREGAIRCRQSGRLDVGQYSRDNPGLNPIIRGDNEGYYCIVITHILCLYPSHTKLVLTTSCLRPDYVLTTFCSERDGLHKVLGRFKVLDILACSDSLYYLQVVDTTFR